MVARRQDEECANGEGIELITREHYDEGPDHGMFTHKVYHYHSRIPAFIRWAIPNSLTDFHEKAWAAFPHEKMQYVVPALENRTSIFIDCYSYPYSKEEGFPENPCHLTDEELAIREIRYMDIVTMEPIPTREDWKLANFQCPEAGINLISEPTRPYDPFVLPEWVEKYEGKMMVNVKCIKCEIKIWGLQTRIENMLTVTTVPGILLESARAITGWASGWGKMTDEEIRQFVLESDQKVNDRIKNEGSQNKKEDTK